MYAYGNDLEGRENQARLSYKPDREEQRDDS